MKSRADILAPLLLFILSLLLRIFLVGKGAYNVDCLGITIQAEKLLQDGQLNYFLGFGFPLTIIIASIFVWIGQLFSVSDAVIAVNYMGVVFGALCIPVYYYLIEKLMDRPAALIGAILLSLCPVFLGYSLLGMTHAPALFFQLLAMLNAISFVKSRQKSRLFISALCFGLFGAVRFPDMVLMSPALAYIYLFLDKETAKDAGIRYRLKECFTFLAVGATTTLLFHMPYLLGQFRSHYIEQLGTYKQLSLVYFDGVFFVTAFLYSIKLLATTLSAPGLIVCLLSLILFYKDERRLFWLMIIWIAVPLLLFANLFTIAPRHQILMIPAFIALECYTLRKFMLFNIRFRLSAIIVFFLIIHSTFIHYLPVFVYRHHHSVITAYARWLGQVTEKDAHIIATDISAFIQRYGGRTPGVRVLHSRHLYSQKELKEYQRSMEELLDQGIPVYITETGLYTYDPQEQFSKFMFENFEIKYMEKFPYEDWHRGFLFVDIFQNSLYKIGKKP